MRSRLRQTIERRRGDQLLRSLDDQQLVQALRLVESRADALVPNLAGLLMLGREPVLQRVVPTHEVAFQVLDSRGAVLVNSWYSAPLLKTLEAVEERFAARNQEREVTVGLLRLPLPDYAPEAFREAIVNAIQHRDYARRGAVYVQLHPDHLFIANPGGFVDGLTLDNLLVHEPKPRNARLTEALRRVGLVETTGRGIDRIYLGQLWYGRPLPDYAQSSSDSVRLALPGGSANLAFAAFVYEQERADRLLTLDELLVLSQLQLDGRVDTQTVGVLTQRGAAHARGVLQRLAEWGLVEARGERPGREFQLSTELKSRSGPPGAAGRPPGYDRARQEALILQYVQDHGRITRREAMRLGGLSQDQASRLLRQLARQHLLHLVGTSRATAYTRPTD